MLKWHPWREREVAERFEIDLVEAVPVGGAVDQRLELTEGCGDRVEGTAAARGDVGEAAWCAFHKDEQVVEGDMHMARDIGDHAGRHSLEVDRSGVADLKNVRLGLAAAAERMEVVKVEVECAGRTGDVDPFVAGGDVDAGQGLQCSGCRDAALGLSVDDDAVQQGVGLDS